MEPTRWFRYHFWLAGTMYHGAQSVEVLEIVDPSLQPSPLLVPADVKKEFHDHRAALVERPLEGDDLVEALPPNRLRDEIMNPDDQHVLVMAPVENGRLALGRHLGVHPPQKVVPQILLGRRPEGHYSGALWVEAAHDMPDGPVLA